MIPHQFCSLMAALGFLWIFCMLHVAWPSQGGVTPQRPSEPEPLKPWRTRSKEPQPFGGLTRKPLCALCDQEATPPTPPPPVRPAPMPPPHRRPRAIDTSRHLCPPTGCDYRGWVGLGNLRAHGHPNGGPWRQCHCTACQGSCPEPHGTLFHGKRVAVDLLVHVIGCLAAGLGIRGTARGFEVAPNTGLQWLVEAAAQLRAFAQYILHALHVTPVELDALSAVLRALKGGTVSEEEAIERLSRSPQWVWAALDPESKVLLTIDVGERTLALAQRVGHQVVQGLAPAGAPLFL